MPRFSIDGRVIEVTIAQAYAVAEYIHAHRVPINLNQLTIKEATRRSLIEQGIWTETETKEN